MEEKDSQMKIFTLSQAAQKKLSGMCKLFEKFTGKGIDENELLNRIVLQTAADLAADNEERARKVFQEGKKYEANPLFSQKL